MNDPLVIALQKTSSQLAAQVQNCDALMQQASTALGAGGIRLGIEANEVCTALRQNLKLNDHYLKQVDSKLNLSYELVRIGTLLNSSLDLEQVLQEVMDTIILLTNAARAYLMLLRETGLIVQIARNWDRETLSEDEIVFSRGVVEKSLASGEVILSANVQTDPRFKGRESVFSHQLHSVLCVPLSVRGNSIGVIYADTGDMTTPFSPDLMSALLPFAVQAAVAIDNAQLYQQAQSQANDLRKSRKRIITSREEERRRLRRDLHDGLGPILASLTLKLDRSRKLLKASPEAVEKSLVELKGQVKDILANVRQIVADLRPPTLDDLGLVGALKEYAQQLSGLYVVIVAPDKLPQLPAAVEVAIYRIATEALTNVVRHAQAQHCMIRLTVDKGLLLEITDDGRGMLPQRSAGVGLHSMEERASELGGTCKIEHPPEGGTCIRIYLPLGAIAD